jgi:hypothetical protein
MQGCYIQDMDHKVYKVARAKFPKLAHRGYPHHQQGQILEKRHFFYYKGKSMLAIRKSPYQAISA